MTRTTKLEANKMQQIEQIFKELNRQWYGEFKADLFDNPSCYMDTDEVLADITETIQWLESIPTVKAYIIDITDDASAEHIMKTIRNLKILKRVLKAKQIRIADTGVLLMRNSYTDFIMHTGYSAVEMDLFDVYHLCIADEVKLSFNYSWALDF